MSKYFDSKSSFLEPTVKQYGSHMIMTNVNKENKQKFININTKYRDENSHSVGTSSLANCMVTLPEKIHDAKSMLIYNAEIPVSFYNISASVSNHYFQVINLTTIPNKYVMVDISDGEYTATALSSTMNTRLQRLYNAGILDLSLQYVYDASTNRSSFHLLNSNPATQFNAVIKFDVNSDGTVDKYNFKNKLGWMLGFRKTEYNMINLPSVSVVRSHTSEQFVDLTGLKYIYLVIDDFGKGGQNSFICNYNQSLISKNIIAKISLNKQYYPFGSVIPVSHDNGYMLSDKRMYSGKIDLQKMNIQLIDEIGNVIDLNGHDFSFCMIVEHE